MKLFVWERVFCDYSCGIAFALANTKEEAIELIANSYEEDTESWFYKDIVRKLTETEPNIHNIGENIGYMVKGGG